MITAYRRKNGALQAGVVIPQTIWPDDAIWIDLLSPTGEEEHVVERALSLDVPTREEMSEIEISSRLYQEDGISYMTATLLTGADTGNPENVPVTFVLAGQRLVTLRYAEPKAFAAFAAQVQRQAAASACVSGEAVLAELLDAVVDRLADILEQVQREMNQVSRIIFARRKIDFEDVLRQIGLAEGLTSRARESLVSIGRLLLFLTRPGESKPAKTLSRSFKTLLHDVQSLSDHASYLANNINFLLDATLGMINIEQTGIIKIFSVAAVVLMPPTLVASIYGMNFEFMPELKLGLGYPLSLLLMVISAVLPYLYFKRRGWL